MIEWAKKEVELACKKENPDWDGENFDYGCACYQSALEAYEVLSKQNHSGFSWAATRSILIRLMNNQVLTPIEDTEDVWHECYCTPDGVTYQCNRMSSLFKTVHYNGQVTYSDNDRQFGIADSSDISFGSRRVTNCVDALFPITMPYMPETNKYKVLFHNDEDDYPYAVIKPDGEKIDVRYTEDKGYERVLYVMDGTSGKWIAVDVTKEEE